MTLMCDILSNHKELFIARFIASIESRGQPVYRIPESQQLIRGKDGNVIQFPPPIILSARCSKAIVDNIDDLIDILMSSAKLNETSCLYIWGIDCRCVDDEMLISVRGVIT